MNKLILTVICTALSICMQSQIVRQNETFDAVAVINNKVAFVKEIAVDQDRTDSNYKILKEWAKENYGKDPFISSVRYDNKKNGIIAKSRIELILPENARGIRERMIMRFRVNGYLVDDKCVLEVVDLSFLSENSQDKKLPRVIKAEDFITDEKTAIADDLQELKINTKKSTLYFINSLAKELETAFGY